MAEFAASIDYVLLRLMKDIAQSLIAASARLREAPPMSSREGGAARTAGPVMVHYRVEDILEFCVFFATAKEY